MVCCSTNVFFSHSGGLTLAERERERDTHTHTHAHTHTQTEGSRYRKQNQLMRLGAASGTSGCDFHSVWKCVFPSIYMQSRAFLPYLDTSGYEWMFVRIHVSVCVYMYACMAGWMHGWIYAYLHIPLVLGECRKFSRLGSAHLKLQRNAPTTLHL